MCDDLQMAKPPQYITNTEANSAFYLYGV